MRVKSQGMVANPNEDTDPRVSVLFVGSYLETGMGPQGPAGVGFSVARASHYQLAFYFMNKFKRGLKGGLGILFLISFCAQLLNASSADLSASADMEQFAIRTGTSIGLSLILGILLLRSALKKKVISDDPKAK